jgi:hypothetical protein
MNKIEMSRRRLLKIAIRSAGAATVVGFAAADASAANKVPKQAVAYRDSPNGNQRCDNCAVFEPPNACQLVAGTVKPNGWCRIYRPKA